MFVNTAPRYEILSEDAMDTLDKGWKRIVSEIGVEFASPWATEMLAAAGQDVDGIRVRFDPEWVLAQVAKAPSEFQVHARNPEHTVTIGGDNMVFAGVYGPPFARRGDHRAEGTLEDFRNFAKLCQVFPQMDSAGGVLIEPNDAPLDSRHLDMSLALQTLTDKVYMGNVVRESNAEDMLNMAGMVFGGREKLNSMPVMISLANCNSPLHWDDRMLDAVKVYALANQPVLMTPFLIMGAMSPVAIPAALAQLMAEAFTGIALAQLINPGAPVILGSFLTNANMQSGSTCMGTPETAIGLFAIGQIARRYNLPFRSGGGFTSSQSVDAQAGYEALMTMMPTFLAGVNYVLHAGGWLESGLVSSYEKFIVDMEILGMLHATFAPLEITEESLAFGAHEEVMSSSDSRHFLGTAHTMERFRDCFYRPLLSSSDAFERWEKNGGKDACERAGEIATKKLEEYEEPTLDPAIRQELEEYVARRRKELGD
jgi:trimethylamine--corrinoid protein Co-methyltransferase